jgi:riboflavin kinase/FMN adenylyltransferase
VDDHIVSSTLIRQLVQHGDLSRAARFLGREFTILGTVIEGDHLGTQLGFPTANLATHNEQFPPNGVYAVEAWLGEKREHRFKGVVNIGVRPTVKAQGTERLLELHLFDFHDNIYGQNVEVAFRKFLRPEQKFPDLEGLRAQIARDAQAAREALAQS